MPSPVQQVGSGECCTGDLPGLDEPCLVPVADTVYVVLADSPQGYYIVKCLNVNKGTFTGRYFSPISSEDPASECFKETSNKDTFYFETVIGNLVVDTFLCNKLKCIAVTKLDLNDIILTIAEIDES